MSSNPSTHAGLQQRLRENIATLTARRRREESDAPWSDRLAERITAFTGSMIFVLLHLIVFGGWIIWNLWFSPKFDPSFVILAMIASVEAIFLSTFVLISQNRMQAAADRRANLDLHINLLAEHELTKLSELVAAMARKMDIDTASPEFEEIQSDVNPEQVLDALDPTQSGSP